MDNIKVIMCDDMPYILQCFKIIFDGLNDITLIGTASSSKELFELLKKELPDIVILDIQLSYFAEGIDILKKIKKLYPSLKVIILTVYEEDDLIFNSIAEGASDYIIKSAAPDNIAQTIRNVYNDVTALSPHISQKLIMECMRTKSLQKKTLSLLNCVALLTASEYKILQLVYEGYSYSEIAQQRFVEDVTVRTQISKILKKFNKKSLSELIDELKQIQFFNFNINYEEQQE